jgi:replication-associated recombination protein RarA
MKFNTTTEAGYSMYECSSAIQKAIRRGLEEEAMYWAVELWRSNFDEYLWKRLRIISSEDVGLACPGISSEIWSLYQMYKLQKAESKKIAGNERPSERIFLTHAVVLLCRAPKSRIIDHLQVYHFRQEHSPSKHPVPDWAFDKHTKTGRKLKRGIDHFFQEGAKLENCANLPMEEEYKQRAWDLLSQEKTNALEEEAQEEYNALTENQKNNQKSLF